MVPKKTLTRKTSLKKVDTIEKLAILMQEGFANIDVRFDQLEARMDRLEARMDNLESDIGEIRVEIGSIHRRLDALEARADSNAGFAKEIDDLRRRLARAERLLERKQRR